MRDANDRKTCSAYAKTRQADFRIKHGIRDQEGYFTMTRASIHQEYVMIIILYALKNRQPEHMQRKHERGSRQWNSS